ncbi:hypothetical protein [Neisseria mucosa]|uniref:hypothetical protein n=1 Tax=Neisseria mucosa TaxID=488 RepID=UPI00355720F8
MRLLPDYRVVEYRHQTCEGDKVFFGYRFKFKRSSENLNLSFQTTFAMYSGLTLNQYGVASPCRTICTVCGFVALS